MPAGWIKTLCHDAGFEMVGITAATVPTGLDRFQAWLQKGYAGLMGYLQKHAIAREDVASILPETKSIVLVGMSYHTPKARHLPIEAGVGRVASYAQGQDYHQVFWDKLNGIVHQIQQQYPEAISRAVTDTAPLLERDFARLAGLGWFGKNTMLIHKKQGSFFLLGAILTSLKLDADDPLETSHCGTCRACLDACPTKAFPEPGTLDATKCISYWTIEVKGHIPEAIRPGLGDWLFGCDICQDVCPWNRKAPPGQQELLSPSQGNGTHIDLLELLQLTEAEFRHRFRTTALWRTKRTGLLRNACIVLANQKHVAAIPHLQRLLETETDPVMVDTARWAIQQLRNAR